MFGRLGPFELLLILAVVLIIFGPKKLPEIGSAIGKAVQNFREGFKTKQNEDRADGSSGAAGAKRPDAPAGPQDKG